MKQQECIDSYNSTTYEEDFYCNAIFDGFLCWPSTQYNETVTLSCPRQNGFYKNRKAIRFCDGIQGNWTNDTFLHSYKQCITPELEMLIKLMIKFPKESVREVARIARKIEITGLILSLFTLLVSLFIFYHYRTLRNNRTRIHKNLFIALVIQVLVRLIIYIDQMLIQEKQFIERQDYICEGAYTLLEFARTAMFMWMFVEGLYLHNVITVTVFQEYSYYKVYFLIGWGLSVVAAAAWAMTMSFYLEDRICWYGYSLQPIFWMIEGPRMAVIVLNLLFLFNIIRVLVVKVRQSHASEIEQVRKAVRAAVFLLPLMGISNILSVINTSQIETLFMFAVITYVTSFLNTFQGFFIAVLYCFLNGEVKNAVKNSFSVYMSLRTNRYKPRRNSTFMSTVTENDS